MIEDEAAAAAERARRVTGALSPDPDCPTVTVSRDREHRIARRRARSYTGFWDELSCTNLFSTTPPTSGLSGRINASLRPSAAAHWSPVCGYTQFAEAVSNNRVSGEGELTDADITAGTTAFLNDVSGIDACAAAASGGAASVLRTADGYVPPTETESGFTRMNALQRRQAHANARRIRNSVRDTCCNDGNARCRELMDQVEIRFCDPDTEADCTDGAYYNQPDEFWDYLDQYRRDNPTGGDPGEFQPNPGYFVISPFNDGGVPYDNMQVIAHELGHACSSIRRQLSVAVGVPAAGASESLEQIHDLAYRLDGDGHPVPGGGCTIDAAHRRVMGGLFSAGGTAESATISCLVTMSNHIANQRFLSGSCPDACPGEALEESFADLQSMLATPSSVLIPEFLPDACWGGRDNEHPWLGDELACFLQTPTFRQHLAEATGCTS